MTFTSRSGEKEVWQMANGNETWIDPATLRNIERVYEFLASEREKAARAGKAQQGHSYSQIARAVGMNPKQVQFACTKLAYHKNPFIKVKASHYRGKNGVRTTEKVTLLRTL